VPSIQAERAYYLEKIKDQGFISVPFGITGADIDPLFSQFREYLDLCEQPGGQVYREAIAEKPPEGCRTIGGDYFVTRRRRGEVNSFSINKAPSTEDKDVAHIGPRSIALAESRVGRQLPVAMRTFLGSCVELHEAAKAAVRPVYRALGVEHVMLARDPMEDEHVIRLLRYLGTAANLKADLHFDRSAFTLAAWESHPGLVGAPANNAQRQSLGIEELEERATAALASPIQHNSGRAKVFLGAGYNRLPNQIFDINGRQPLLLHGVRNERPEEERDAVVVFMHPPAHYPGYIVPGEEETGIDTVRAHILRRSPAHEEVA
jgi:hypothetical protein